VWYGPIESEPVVNSAGQSMVMEPGWSTLHEWELSGANASHAYELLERAGQWTQMRWGCLSRLLWPGRGSVAGNICWPDVVNQVSELANNATLPRPEWSVIVGENRAWWPVAMWKRRDEFTLGEPQYTAEDVERIGEDPEVVLSARKHWLKDSETALEWLADKLKNQEQIVAPVVVAVDPVVTKPTGRRGRLPKAESQLLETNMMARLREHPTLMDDPEQLATLTGVSPSTARRLIDSEREKFSELRRKQ